MNIRLTGLLAGMMLLSVMLIPVYALGEAETKAVEAAEQWLEMIDQGQFAESWDYAAVYFQKAIEREQWRQTLSAVRIPLGLMVSRKLKSAEYYTSLPGAPDGEYVVIQFDTSFENKKDAVETITPIREPDGNWRASGYYIK
jgi:hypothetical protein